MRDVLAYWKCSLFSFTFKVVAETLVVFEVLPCRGINLRVGIECNDLTLLRLRFLSLLDSLAFAILF